jgi:probable phosphoglycerate mutase
VTVKPPPKSPEPPFSVRRPFLHLEEQGVTRLTMVRHAQQEYPTGEYNPDDWDDPPLSGLGVTQAMAVSTILAEDHEVDVVACSTMGRARQTAQIIASPHGLEPDVRPDLVEVQTYRDLDPGADPRQLMSAEEWADRESRFERFVQWDLMPFGEGSREFRERAVTAVERLVADHEGKAIVLVSHGGVINAYLGWILGIEEDMFFLPNHCSITTVWAKGDVRRVHSMNERNHLHVGILTN